MWTNDNQGTAAGAGFDLSGADNSQGGASSDLGDVVDGYVFDLERVARGEQIAWNLSGVCDGIARRARRAERITREERDRLRAALRAAFAKAAAPLASTIGAGMVDLGRRAMDTLAVRWAQDEADRATRLPGEMADLGDQARIFQNAVHSVCLVEDIAIRAAHRVDALCRAAV